MMIEFERDDIPTVFQYAIKVFFEGEIVGEYFTDMLFDDNVIIEIKTERCLAFKNEGQLLSYHKATDKEFGLLLNFDPRREIKRKMIDNILENNGLCSV